MANPEWDNYRESRIKELELQFPGFSRAMAEEIEDYQSSKGSERRNCMGPDLEHQTTNALDKAKEIVCGDRARDYGKPSENHKSTALMWEAYLRLPPGTLDERDVCAMNMMQKLSRDRWRRINDNPVDLAGYAQNMSWVGDPRNGKTLGELNAGS